MRFVSRLLILSLAFTPLAPAAWAFDFRERKLSELVLDSEDFLDLNIEQRVAYLKFFLNFMGTIESMQDLPAGEKTALREPLEHFFAVLEPRAEAAYVKDATIVGSTCINLLNQSTYAFDEASGRYYCQAHEEAGSTCDAGLKSCGAKLRELVPDLGETCIPPGDPRTRTSRCVDKIVQTAGVNLDKDLMKKSLTVDDPEESAKFDALAAEMREGLKRFESRRLGGLTLHQYCAGENKINHGLQKEECEAITRLETAFHSATALKRSTFAGNSLRNDPSPEVDKGMQEVRAGRKPHTLTPSPPPPPRASGVPRSASPGGSDCHSRYGAKLGKNGLACVACGLENLAEADVKNHGGGVANYLSLMGAMTQSYYGPFNVNDQSSREAYQERVIDMVSSFGYCTDNEYPVRSDGSDLSRRLVEGRAQLRTDEYGAGGVNEGRFADEYGFAPPDSIAGSPLVYGADMFDENIDSNGPDSGSPQERRQRFLAKANSFAADQPTAGFSQCAKAINHRVNHSSLFKMCGGHEGHMNPREVANYQALRGSMSKACGLPVPPPPPKTRCDRDCWPNRVNGYQGETTGSCGHRKKRKRVVTIGQFPPGPPGLSEPETPRWPPLPVVPEEPSMFRSPGGNSNAGSRGNPGGGPARGGGPTGGPSRGGPSGGPSGPPGGHTSSPGGTGNSNGGEHSTAR